MIGWEDATDNAKVGESLGQLIVRSDPFHALNVNEQCLTSMPSELSIRDRGSYRGSCKREAVTFTLIHLQLHTGKSH